MSKNEIYTKAICDFVVMKRQIDRHRLENFRKGAYINLFSIWNEFSGITEPIHSRILHFILSDNAMHGQRFLFLSLFLRRLGIATENQDEWIVTAETGRVDIMLKRFQPRSVIIIENKSNWASDQPNQLYRYWYQNIHKTHEDCQPEYYKEHPEFKIIYLTPNKNKLLSDDSVRRPADYPANLPNVLPIKPIVFSFDEEISEWLTECIRHLPKENTPLIYLLSQYNDYCKNL